MRQREKKDTNEDYVDDEERKKLFVCARGCFDFPSLTLGAHSVDDEIIAS